MIATYVPPVKTPVSRDAVVKAFLWALPSGLSLSGVALALAQSALETGRWKSMWNWNIGNAKAGPKYAGNYTCFRCNEVIEGRRRWFVPGGECDEHGNIFGPHREPVPPGHPQTRFRAYANVYDGTLEHVTLLEKRFAPAWSALLSGDASVFVQALKAHGYFTAEELPYFHGVFSLQREFLDVLTVEDEPWHTPEEDFPEDIARILAVTDAIQFEQAFGLDEDTKPDGRA